jgi:hypothetical protein
MSWWNGTPKVSGKRSERCHEKAAVPPVRGCRYLVLVHAARRPGGRDLLSRFDRGGGELVAGAGRRLFKENGIDAKLIYMEGGRLSIQSLLSGHTQFMAGDAVSALAAVGAGADIVLLASAKNMLPYVFAVAKEIGRIQDLKGKIVGISQIGGRAGEIARMVVKNNGLDPDKDVIYLAVGGTVSRLAALSVGRVQAAPISKGMVPTAQEKGQYHRSRAHPADHRCAMDDAQIRRG